MSEERRFNPTWRGTSRQPPFEGRVVDPSPFPMVSVVVRFSDESGREKKTRRDRREKTRPLPHRRLWWHLLSVEFDGIWRKYEGGFTSRFLRNLKGEAEVPPGEVKRGIGHEAVTHSLEGRVICWFWVSLVFSWFCPENH